jgi:nicotinamide-nucleotide amidase
MDVSVVRTAALVVVGTEVLSGSTTDTNSGFVCRQVAARGALVLQICTVPDDLGRIERALAQAAELGPDLIVTMGGLGPTRDDITVAAIARYLGRPLHLDEAALAIVNSRYQELAAKGLLADAKTEDSRRAREKMAMFPAGAEAISNSVGAAPAVYLDLGERALLALPGAPNELRSIVLDHATHVFDKWLGTGAIRSATVATSTQDESVLDGAFRDFDQQAPANVYLKSRPRRTGDAVLARVTLSVRESSEQAAGDLLRRSVALLQTALERRDVQVLGVDFDT